MQSRAATSRAGRGGPRGGVCVWCVSLCVMCVCVCVCVGGGGGGGGGVIILVCHCANAAYTSRYP